LKQLAKQLDKLVEDGCLLLANTVSGKQDRIKGVIGLDPESARIRLLVADQNPVAAGLIQAAERLAVSFGIVNLQLRIRPGESRLMTQLGYRSAEPAGEPTENILQRSLSRRLTAEARKAAKVNQQLGIPADYGRRHRLRLQTEPRQLASLGLDVSGREQFMIPQAAKALHTMIAAAAHDNVTLQVVSAFRTVDYQYQLVQRKLEKGLRMDEILKVSAAPGYSEHHSGRAVDLTTPDYATLEESFADSAAFDWLSRHAADFGFRMSYPLGNRHGVAYEPWHWRYEL
jgi:D-alanyl-D-alanine carboxypeptidase